MKVKKGIAKKMAFLRYDGKLACVYAAAGKSGYTGLELNVSLDSEGFMFAVTVFRAHATLYVGRPEPETYMNYFPEGASQHA